MANGLATVHAVEHLQLTWRAGRTEPREGVGGERRVVRRHRNVLGATRERVDDFEEARDRVFVAPALGLPITMLREGRDYGLGWSDEKYRSLEIELETTRRCMQDLRRRGVRVLPGGDYGAFVTNPIGTNARDLEHFVDFLGFSPAETLSAATMAGGALMQQGDALGQVRPGFLADLLVVRGDPLADIRILQDPARIEAVMVGGRLVKDRMPRMAQSDPRQAVRRFA